MAKIGDLKIKGEKLPTRMAKSYNKMDGRVRAKCEQLKIQTIYGLTINWPLESLALEVTGFMGEINQELL